MEDFLLSEAFQSLLSALILALVSILTVFVSYGGKAAVAYLRTKLGESQLGMLKEVAATIVRSLAQSPAFEFLEGAEKFERAKVFVLQFARENNLPIDEELIDQVIEEAVQIMKEAGTEVWNVIPDGTAELAEAQ